MWGSLGNSLMSNPSQPPPGKEMRKGLIVGGVTLALLGAFFALAAPYASAGVARPVIVFRKM